MNLQCSIPDRDLTTCPYNPAHRIRLARLEYHLPKCAKAHPHIQLETCPYNVLHRYLKKNEQEHFKECPEKQTNDIRRSGVLEPPEHMCGNLTLPVYTGSDHYMRRMQNKSEISSSSSSDSEDSEDEDADSFTTAGSESDTELTGLCIDEEDGNQSPGGDDSANKRVTDGTPRSHNESMGMERVRLLREERRRKKEDKERKEQGLPPKSVMLRLIEMRSIQTIRPKNKKKD